MNEPKLYKNRASGKTVAVVFCDKGHTVRFLKVAECLGMSSQTFHRQFVALPEVLETRGCTTCQGVDDVESCMYCKDTE